MITPLSSLISNELRSLGEEFRPCMEAVDWLRETFLSEDSPLYNPEHSHLNSAQIGFLWTNAPNSRHGKRIVGTVELAKPPSSLGKWSKARWEWQMRQWFGDVALDFLITLFAPYFAEIDELEQCSGSEHELYHCGQQVDVFGLPKFSRTTGKPLFTIRGHDSEEFVGIARRYGPQACAGDTAALVHAALKEPEIGRARLAVACGACR